MITMMFTFYKEVISLLGHNLLTQVAFKNCATFIKDITKR